jgi:hypothetical protein
VLKTLRVSCTVSRTLRSCCVRRRCDAHTFPASGVRPHQHQPGLPQDPCDLGSPRIGYRPAHFEFCNGLAAKTGALCKFVLGPAQKSARGPTLMCRYDLSRQIFDPVIDCCPSSTCRNGRPAGRFLITRGAPRLFGQALTRRLRRQPTTGRPAPRLIPPSRGKTVVFSTSAPARSGGMTGTRCYPRASSGNTGTLRRLRENGPGTSGARHAPVCE